MGAAPGTLLLDNEDVRAVRTMDITLCALAGPREARGNAGIVAGWTDAVGPVVFGA
ncbi:MAG: hypothetical protein ACE5KF_06050 [Kiloniellaceae bacterium]